MIIPIVSEQEWSPTFAGLLPFEITEERIVCVSPHPDDETLSAGALLAAHRARGADVVVAAVTDGENAYADCAGLGELRHQEQVGALQRLGIDPANLHRFKLTDTNVAQQTEKLVELLQPLITRGTHVLAPWTGDFHPDHEACGKAAQQVAHRMGVPLSFYFFWTWHRGTPVDVKGLRLRAFRFNESLLTVKLEALSCHHSQLHKEGGDPILPDILLGPAKRLFEVFATA